MIRPAICRLLACWLLVAGAAEAQRPAAPNALPGRVVEIEAGEFYFRSPDSIPAGLTTFQLRQVGVIARRVQAGGASFDSLTAGPGDPTEGLHMLWIVPLKPGQTVAEFFRAAKEREPGAWAGQLGGPGFAMPPGSANATLVLEPGTYVLACRVGSLHDDQTRYHLLHGMFRGLTVVPSRTPSLPLPSPDVILRVAAAGEVSFSAPLVAGRRTVSVHNESGASYELQIRRVLPGHPLDEALAWRRRDQQATPMPFEIVGGLSDVPRGGSLMTTITFTAGDYFIGNAKRVPFTVLPTPR